MRERKVKMKKIKRTDSKLVKKDTVKLRMINPETGKVEDAVTIVGVEEARDARP